MEKKYDYKKKIQKTEKKIEEQGKRKKVFNVLSCNCRRKKINKGKATGFSNVHHK